MTTPDDPLPPVLSGVLTPDAALGIARDALVQISALTARIQHRIYDDDPCVETTDDIHRIASTALARSFIYPGEGGDPP